MLKIVPDPPSITKDHSLEEILLQTSEYLVCAVTVAHQTVLLHTTSTEQVMTLAVMHEIDAARSMIELALSKVQLKH
ncbi:hypothetical protein PS627_04360 [Pseudomonas fluorescens]|uniref:hypothetical protein n=1 Tax=Pseudomonas fluorescens TaxID=294 RepID=UPI00125268A6|nr:hypothetical protein [Pseudomonas fluorescens]CAG8871231.1 hypothetical protein PS627_04360 [Pseudomonas fluorescens]